MILRKKKVKNKEYLVILQKLRNDLQNVYMEYLIWIRQMKRNPIPKKIMETWDVFVNDDNFDQEGIRDCH
jgi:hypothetical protein